MFNIQLARQGQTMEQGTLVQWKKQVGEDIAIGEELYEIETEKAVLSIEATRPGKLLKLMVSPGETIAVGAVLALAADPGESVSADEIAAAVLAGSTTKEAAGDRSPGADPVRVPAKPSPAATRPVAVPKARALAQQLGIDLASVPGSGENGMILPEDVRRTAGAVSSSANSRRVPLTPIAKTMLAALERAWQTPQFTQGIVVDATALARARSSSAGQLSYTDYFLDAIVRAARAVPEILVRLTEKELLYSDSIDISIATATPAGLLIPVLRNSGALTISERSQSWHELVERARAGRLTPDETSGGIITLSNLGSRGVDYGTPLLPYGHSAIVFVGSLATRPLVVDDRLEARLSVHIGITYDHRVVDGVLASRFTGALKEALLTP